MASPEVCCLVQVNCYWAQTLGTLTRAHQAIQVDGGPWHRRLVTLKGSSMHILRCSECSGGFLNPKCKIFSLESLGLVVEVRGEEVVGVKRVEGGLSMSLYVR